MGGRGEKGRKGEEAVDGGNREERAKEDEDVEK